MLMNCLNNPQPMYQLSESAPMLPFQVRCQPIRAWLYPKSPSEEFYVRYNSPQNNKSFRGKLIQTIEEFIQPQQIKIFCLFFQV